MFVFPPPGAHNATHRGGPGSAKTTPRTTGEVEDAQPPKATLHAVSNNYMPEETPTHPQAVRGI